MSEKRFVCIDVGYGDDWYITDSTNGKKLSEMEIVDLLNKLAEENEQLKEIINNLSILLEQSLHKQIFYKYCLGSKKVVR